MKSPHFVGSDRSRYALDEPLSLRAIANKLRDRDDLKVVLGGEAFELRQSHHRAVRVHELADGGRRLQPREPAEVDRGLCLARADEDAAFAGAQRVDVSGHHEVVRRGVRVRQHLDRPRAVRRRDARRHPLPRVDGDRERGSERRLVVLHHHRNVQAVEALAGHRDADHAARVAEHESDVLRRRELACDHQIAFVLAVLVVDDHDEPSTTVFFDSVFDGIEVSAADLRLTVLLDRLDLR